MRAHHLRLKAERGFTTVVVMGMLLVGMLLVAAAFAATNNDTSVSRHDQYYKEAYNAAEAGLNWYYFHLTQDANFWQSCTTGPVNTAGTAWASEVKNTIPGSEAQYALEILPTNIGGTCSVTDGSSIINPTTGTFRVRSTGSYRGVRRTVIGTFKRTSFLNFIWFTDYETNDPVVPRSGMSAKQVATQCTKHNWGTNARNMGNCDDPAFITGDTMAGPVRSNDEFYFCGNPTFGRAGKKDLLQTAAPNFYYTCSGASSSPTLNSTPKPNQTGLVMPPSNATLKTHADCILTGPTHITINGTSISITQNGVTKSCPYANGVIYVQNGTCSNDFVTSETYPSGSGCGDAWVHTGSGSNAAAVDLTIAADNDIIIDGSILRKSGTTAAVGLIANNFVRVYHPSRDSRLRCTSNFTPSSGEDAGVGVLSNPEIDAAILSLKHGFIVDNWDCGAPLGTLKVVGAIAQEYRGTVGTFDSSGVQSGYIKNYTYDDALRYHDPPYFLDPVQAGWDIQSETEQVPSH